MDKTTLPIVLIGLGAFTIVFSGKPEVFSFQALGDTLTGVVFIAFGLIIYFKNKKNKESGS